MRNSSSVITIHSQSWQKTLFLLQLSVLQQHQQTSLKTDFAHKYEFNAL